MLTGGPPADGPGEGRRAAEGHRFDHAVDRNTPVEKSVDRIPGRRETLPAHGRLLAGLAQNRDARHPAVASVDRLDAGDASDDLQEARERRLGYEHRPQSWYGESVS